jgi:acetyl-CoA carboxylase, biotin carboxylase subunit
MFKKILVANRGEIAVRVLRTCRELGIPSVAVYSDADAESIHRRLADESVRIGEPPSAKSYLNIDRILAAAAQTGADAIHPGYGYLAEKEAFAEACRDRNIAFIGPTPHNLAMAGDKIAGKRIIEAAGVQVVPSSPGSVDTLADAVGIASEIGYPIMIKSAGGGGGRGIRICRDEAGLREEFAVARMEAGAACGNPAVYIEKYLLRPRHLEFQILADRHGNVTHLGERECTIQRRYQKLIEEAPSPRLDADLRRRMGDAAIAAAQAIEYVNAGTVEFLLDDTGRFYFIEINARIQVEHPVTELIWGIDLVKEQIRLAAGEELGYSGEALESRGWAIECRINAEDPDRGFLPSPGRVSTYHAPGGFGVRVDSHLYQGYELPIYYDSLVAKLISFAPTRMDAIRIMRRALAEYTIEPLKTTIPLYRRVMDDPDFQQGDFDTGYITRFVPDDDDEEED